jgi:hypothetical protein
MQRVGIALKDRLLNSVTSIQRQVFDRFSEP